MKLESNHHSVFLMHYHLILVVKYRPVFCGVKIVFFLYLSQFLGTMTCIRRAVLHKEMRGLDRYREQPKEYKYHDPYDDWLFRQLADIDNRNNIPDTSPQVDFNEGDYEDYLKAKWNRGL